MTVPAPALTAQADAAPADSADSQRKRRAWLMASCAMGVNPKSMVSKGPEYGLPELGRRSAPGTACIRGRLIACIFGRSVGKMEDLSGQILVGARRRCPVLEFRA